MTSRPTARENRLRREFVERAAAAEADLLTTAISAYARAEGIDWEQVAQEIGCDTNALDRIACCRPPRPQEFAEDAGTIARHVGVDPVKLLALLRKLDVIREFIDTDRGETGPRYTQDQMLLAARDREPDGEPLSDAEAEDA